MFKQKLLLSESYKGVKQLNSDVVLIKSAEHNAIMSQDDYGLKEVNNRVMFVQIYRKYLC